MIIIFVMLIRLFIHCLIFYYFLDIGYKNQDQFFYYIFLDILFLIIMIYYVFILIIVKLLIDIYNVSNLTMYRSDLNQMKKPRIISQRKKLATFTLYFKRINHN